MDNQDQVNTQTRQFKINPKLVVIVAVLGITLALVVFRFAVNQSTPKTTQSQAPVTTKVQPAPPAQLLLITADSAVNVGSSFDVRVRLVTGGKPTLGTDLVLKYDPTLLEASANSISRGTLYSEYPVAVVDLKLGEVRISGIAGVDKKNFTGNGTFATIKLKALKAGSTQLTIDHTPGQTADSNIVDSKSGADILEKVQNLSLTIR